MRQKEMLKKTGGHKMKIDAHQHFWSTSRPNDYGFLTPMSGILYKDYLPEHLEPCLKANGIDYTVVVQAAETEEETRWLLEMTKNTNYIAGVIGWVDFDEKPERFTKSLRALQQHQKFTGIRPMLQDIADDRFILRSQVLENLRTIASLDIPFELLVYPRHLPYVYEMLQQVPSLRAVINHLAKPVIQDHQLEPWSSWMKKISKFPNVWCKLSGMVTEANHKNWIRDDFIPYVFRIVEFFGPDRLLFGSDWPVCLQAATYNQVYSLIQDLLREYPRRLSPHDLENIFGNNAATFYHLDLKDKI